MNRTGVLSSRSDRKLAVIASALLYLFAIVAVWTLWTHLSDRYDMLQVQKWPTVMGKITHVDCHEELTSGSRKSSMGYTAIVYFDYSVNGVPYSNKQDSFFDTQGNLFCNSLFEQNDAEKIKASYSEGKAVPVYYKPNVASISYIDPNVSLIGMGPILKTLSLAALCVTFSYFALSKGWPPKFLGGFVGGAKIEGAR